MSSAIGRVVSAAVALVGLSVGLAPVASADRLGEPCDDWMRLSADPVTGEQMVCSAAGSPATNLWWRVASEAGSEWVDLPMVGAAGTPCSAAPFAFGQSADGYVVWCMHDAARALLPGDRYLENPPTPVWSLYAP